MLPGRALRQVAGMRKQMTSADILAVTRDSLDPTAPLFSLVTAAMEAEASRDGSAAASTPGAGGDVDMAEAPADAKAKSPAPPSVLPEVEVFLSLLSLLRLSDAGRTSEMLPLAEATVERVTALNRRSLDILGARVLFYWSWAHERLGTLASIRSRLLALHR